MYHKNTNQTPTLGSTLLDSIRDENMLGMGDRNAVFSINGSPEYLARVPLRHLHSIGHDGVIRNFWHVVAGEEPSIDPTETLHRALTRSTRLTPAHEIYTPRNVAQPLLTLESRLGSTQLQIIERQSGQSLHEVAAGFNKKLGKAARHIAGYQKMAERLIEHGPEGFKHLLVDWYHLISHNKKPSSNLENVFYSGADGCCCIDIFDHIDKLKVAFHSKPLAIEHVEKRLAHRCTRLIEHFEKALHQPGAVDTPEEVQSYMETLGRLKKVIEIARDQAVDEVKHQGPAFQKVSHVGAVRLDGTSAQMLAVLDHMKAARQPSVTR